MSSSTENDEERLLRSPCPPCAAESPLPAPFAEVKELEDLEDEADDGTVEILRSLPRPLMPLLEFL